MFYGSLTEIECLDFLNSEFEYEDFRIDRDGNVFFSNVIVSDYEVLIDHLLNYYDVIISEKVLKNALRTRMISHLDSPQYNPDNENSMYCY